MSPASMLSPMGRAVLREATREVLVRRSFLARLQDDAETIADLPDEIAPTLTEQGFYDSPEDGAR